MAYPLLFLLVVATVYTLDVTVINECDERIEVLFEGGLRVGDDGRNRTSIEPSESYHRNVSSHYGSITATGISSGNAMRGRTEAVFFNLFGPSFAISIFEGFDYPMKIVTSSGKKITCEKRACFGKFLGLPIPIQIRSPIVQQESSLQFYQFVVLRLPESGWKVSHCASLSTNLVVTILASLIYIRILATTKNLHINLRLLFSVSVLNDLCLLANRIFDIINVSGTLDENDIVVFIKYNSWTFSVVVLFTIVCERIYSIRTFQSYDRSSNSFPSVCIAIVTCEFIACLFFTLMMILGYVDRRIYVKVALLIAFVSLLAITYITSLTVVVAAVLFVRSQNPHYYLLSVQMVYIWIGPRVIGACVIAIKRHPALRKEWRQIQYRLFGNPHTVQDITIAESTTVRFPVHSATGVPLSFAPEREQDIYFQGYASTWRHI